MAVDSAVEGRALRDFDATLLHGPHLVGIVGEELDPRDLEVVQDRHAGVVAPLVGAEA